MTDKQLDLLLSAACKASAKSRMLGAELGEHLIKRWGVHPSDVDCDEIIDALDYGLGDISLKEADEAMAFALKIKRKRR